MCRDSAVELPFELARMTTREEMSELPVQRYDEPLQLLMAIMAPALHRFGSEKPRSGQAPARKRRLPYVTRIILR
jgi:hypothetical protein